MPASATRPQQAQPAFKYTTLIGDTLYAFSFQYNTRCDHWTVDLSLPDGTPVYLGRKLVLGFPLYLNAVVDALPAEVLFALDAQGLLQAIGRNDLGNGAQVYAAV